MTNIKVKKKDPLRDWGGWRWKRIWGGEINCNGKIQSKRSNSYTIGVPENKSRQRQQKYLKSIIQENFLE